MFNDIEWELEIVKIQRLEVASAPKINQLWKWKGDSLTRFRNRNSADVLILASRLQPFYFNKAFVCFSSQKKWKVNQILETKEEKEKDGCGGGRKLQA